MWDFEPRGGLFLLESCNPNFKWTDVFSGYIFQSVKSKSIYWKYVLLKIKYIFLRDSYVCTRWIFIIDSDQAQLYSVNKLANCKSFQKINTEFQLKARKRLLWTKTKKYFPLVGPGSMPNHISLWLPNLTPKRKFSKIRRETTTGQLPCQKQNLQNYWNLHLQ